MSKFCQDQLEKLANQRCFFQVLVNLVWLYLTLYDFKWWQLGGWIVTICLIEIWHRNTRFNIIQSCKQQERDRSDLNL